MYGRGNEITTRLHPRIPFIVCRISGSWFNRRPHCPTDPACSFLESCLTTAHSGELKSNRPPATQVQQVFSSPAAPEYSGPCTTACYYTSLPFPHALQSPTCPPRLFSTLPTAHCQNALPPLVQASFAHSSRETANQYLGTG